MLILVLQHAQKTVYTYLNILDKMPKSKELRDIGWV